MMMMTMAMVANAILFVVEEDDWYTGQGGDLVLVSPDPNRMIVHPTSTIDFNTVATFSNVSEAKAIHGVLERQVLHISSKRLPPTRMPIRANHICMATIKVFAELDTNIDSLIEAKGVTYPMLVEECGCVAVGDPCAVKPFAQNVVSLNNIGH